jgi:hypothetical protein
MYESPMAQKIQWRHTVGVVSGTGNPGDYVDIVYCTWLKEDGTFTAPNEIHSFDRRSYFFWSITNNFILK